jgi:hypothetical protein
MGGVGGGIREDSPYPDYAAIATHVDALAAHF